MNDAMGSATGPSERVLAYLHAMNEWELASWASANRAERTPNPSAWVPECTVALSKIVSEFCVAAAPGEGGLAFGHPPRFDPSAERVVAEVSAPGDLVIVETLHEGEEVYAGRYRYHLRLEARKWRIARAQWFHRGRWQKYPLPMP